MRTHLITLLFSVLFISSYAQDNGIGDNSFGFFQKEIFLEGNIQYSSINNKSTMNKMTSIGLNPKVGYFVLDNFAVGLQASYNIDKNTTTIPDVDNDIIRKVEETYYAPGLFTRYYFLQLGKRFYTYGELGGNFGKTESFTDIDGERSNEINTKIIDANLNLGLNYFANDNIVITFLLSDVLSYNSSKVDVDDAEAINTFNAKINILDNFFQTAQFGIMFIFN